MRKLQNQLVKFYWAQCRVDGKTNWDLVDDTEDFSIIPTNSKGKIQLEVGELRDIIAEASKVFRADEARVVRAECAEIVKKPLDYCVKYQVVLNSAMLQELLGKILNNSSAKNMDNHYGGDMWSGPSSSHSPSGVYPVPSLPS